MPWLDAVNECPACGERHRLFHPTEGAPLARAVYEYRCPTTEQVVEFPQDYLLKRIESCVPKGTVPLEGPIRMLRLG